MIFQYLLFIFMKFVFCLFHERKKKLKHEKTRRFSTNDFVVDLQIIGS